MISNSQGITERNFCIPLQKCACKQSSPTALPCKNNNRNLILYALSPILPIRRTSSVADDLENHNPIRAALMIALASIFLKEDIKDLSSAAKHLGSKITSKIKFKSKFDYKDYQVSFALIRGSFIEPLVNKLGKFGYFLHKYDKTLFDTKFGEGVRNLLNVKIVDKINIGREVPQIIKDGAGRYNKKMVSVFAQKLSGPFIGKMICRSMQRIMLLEFAIFSAAWLPAIFKSFNTPKQGEDKYKSVKKQILKSLSNVVAIFGSIGFLGAIGSRKGPLGHILGMGAGAVVGTLISNKVNEKLK